MLRRGGIKNPTCIAFRTSRSRKVIGGQLKAILDSIVAIEQEDSPDRTEFPIRAAEKVEICCAARPLATTLSLIATGEQARFSRPSLSTTTSLHRLSPPSLSHSSSRPSPASFLQTPTPQRASYNLSRCWPKTNLVCKRLISCTICGLINISLFHR